MLHTLTRVLVLMGIFMMTGPAFAKRGAPKIAEPVVSDGVEYRVVHDRYKENGRPRGIRAFVEAWDTKTKKALWRVEVYDVRYRGDLETDVQDVYIKDLKFDKSGLTATDERGKPFLIDPKTPAGAIVAGLSAQLNNVTVGKDDSVALDFVLLNHSDAEIVLAERWNSWGAQQWAFRVVDANGDTFKLGNPQTIWFANFFSTFSIPSSKSQVTKCRLDLTSQAFQEGSIAIFSQNGGTVGVEDRRRRKPWVFPLSITGTFSARKENVGYSEKVSSNWAGTIATTTVQIKKTPN